MDFITATVKNNIDDLLDDAKAFYRNNHLHFSKDAARTKLESGCEDWEDGVRGII